ncbi:MAG TPA: zinc ribbon domain-containing protein [Actinomycetota bacterium]
MPIHEYECPGCGSRFDRRVAMHGPDPACPSCGEAKVRRLISVFAATGGAARPTRPAASGPAGGGCCGGSCACGSGSERPRST